MATTTTTVPGAGPISGSRSFLSKLREGDEIARLFTFLFAASVVLLTVLLVYELWIGSSLPRHKFGFNFFRTSVWDPIFDQFGALPFIYGTTATAVVSLLIAVPLGIGAAIFLPNWPRQGFPIHWNSSSISWPPFPASSMVCSAFLSSFP